MLAREAQNIQNPALGAAILWRFCCGYVGAHPEGDLPRLPLLSKTLRQWGLSNFTLPFRLAKLVSLREHLVRSQLLPLTMHQVFSFRTL